MEIKTVFPDSNEFDEAEYRLRQDIEAAIESASDCLHDSKEWWAHEYSGPRTIDTLIGLIVVAAKSYERKSRNVIGATSLQACDRHTDEPAWVSRLANGYTGMSVFTAIDIADQVRELLIYKRACDSMAEQMLCPKMTGLELARMQLKGEAAK